MRPCFSSARRRLLQWNPALGPVGLGSGFYLFICGAGLAAVTALAMLFLSSHGRSRVPVITAPAVSVAGPT